MTNGESCLQREKLDASGLAGYFDVLAVSGDIGAGKPDPAIFRHALGELGVRPQHAMMVGDSLRKDVDGALAAGLNAIWLNRSGAHPSEPPGGDHDETVEAVKTAQTVEIATLAALPALVA